MSYNPIHYGTETFKCVEGTIVSNNASAVLHVELLQLYCRLCGRRTVRKLSVDGTGNGIFLKRSDPYRSLLHQLHDTDVNTENGQIFPKRICQDCVDILENVQVIIEKRISTKIYISVFELVLNLFECSQIEDLRQIQQKISIADFWAHSSSSQQKCSICYDTGEGADASVASFYNNAVKTLSKKPKFKTVITCQTIEGSNNRRDKFSTSDTYKIVSIDTIAIIQDTSLSEECKVITPIEIDGLGETIKETTCKTKSPLSQLPINSAPKKITPEIRLSETENTTPDSQLNKRKRTSGAYKSKIIPSNIQPLKYNVISNVISSSQETSKTRRSTGPGETIENNQYILHSKIIATRKRIQKKLSKELHDSNKDPSIVHEPVSNLRTKNGHVGKSGNIRKKEIEAILRKLNSQWPANRQLRADIIRDLILDKPDAIPLLESEGVIFDTNAGSFHLAALKKQRKIHQNQAEKLFHTINDGEWVKLIANLIFDLLHPEDALTLRTVGLFVDPLSANAPLHFQILFALKTALLTEDIRTAIIKDTYLREREMLSKTTMRHIVDILHIEGNKVEDDDILDGLTNLLYCTEEEAEKLLTSSRSSSTYAKKSPNFKLAKKSNKLQSFLPMTPPNDDQLIMHKFPERNYLTGKPTGFTTDNQTIAPCRKNTGIVSGKSGSKKNISGPKTVHFETNVKRLKSDNNFSNKIVQETTPVFAKSKLGHNAPMSKEIHYLYRKNKISKGISTSPDDMLINENGNMKGAHCSEFESLDPLIVGEESYNKTKQTQENNLCAIRYLAGLHKNGEETNNDNENYGSSGYGETAGPFTTAFEETDNLATQEFVKRCTDDIEKLSSTDSNEYSKRNDHLEDGDDSNFPELPVAHDSLQNDTETTIALLNRVNNYKDLCNQDHSQNLFEDKKYATLPLTEDYDKTPNISQMDSDDVDLCNEMSSC